MVLEETRDLLRGGALDRQRRQLVSREPGDLRGLVARARGAADQLGAEEDLVGVPEGRPWIVPALVENGHELRHADVVARLLLRLANGDRRRRLPHVGPPTG